MSAQIADRARQHHKSDIYISAMDIYYILSIKTNIYKYIFDLRIPHKTVHHIGHSHLKTSMDQPKAPLRWASLCWDEHDAAVLRDQLACGPFDTLVLCEQQG